MNLEQSQKNDYEINLTELFRIMWDGKWLISGITAIASIIAVIYLIFLQTVYIGTLEINPLRDSEASKYNEIDFINLSATRLERLFFQDLITYKGFEESILRNSYLKKNENETERDFSVRVKRVAREFSLSKSEQKKGTKLTLSLITSQPDLAVKVVTDALLISNNNVKIQVESEIDRHLSAYTKGIKNKLEDIEISSNLSLGNEKLKIQSRLAFLIEQTAIAKVLDIKINTINPTEYSFLPTSTQEITTKKTLVNSISINKLVTSIKKEEPYYLRGYLSIDKEIEILSSRESPKLFIAKFIENELSKERLLLDRTTIRAREAITSSPIGNDTFMAVSYDIDSIKLKSTTKSLLILVLSIILGGMIGIFVLTIRNLVKKNK